MRSLQLLVTGERELTHSFVMFLFSPGLLFIIVSGEFHTSVGVDTSYVLIIYITNCLFF